LFRGNDKYNPTDKLPQRQFMGDSAELDKLIISELERKLGKIIKKLRI
jgi:hypothetical protein